jgi:hypothetical protein
MGIVYLVVLLRYRSLIPLMFIFIFVEYLGRELVGLAKPLAVSHIPPGAVGDYVLIPLSAAMFVLSLFAAKKEKKVA